MQWGHRWLAVVWLAWALGSVVAIGAQEAPPAPAAPAPAPPPAEPPPPPVEAPPPAATPAGAAPRQPPAPQPGDNLITMDFQDVDLPVLVKFVSEITGRNFILDERVKGKVTIISPSKITVDEAYAVFQSVLQVKGFTTVPAGSVIKIVQAQEAKSSTVETYLPGRRAGETDEFITKLMPLTNVDANNILPIIQPLISPNGLLAAYAATNTLILIDSAANVSRLSQIIHELDVEGIERDVEVVRLNYAYSPELAAVLAQVLEEQSTPGVVTAPTAPGAPRPPGARRGAQPAAAPAQTAQGGTGEKAFKIIPEERTNSLIVVAGPMLMRRIRELIVRLDVPIPAGTERVNVYYLKYASAFEIVPVLSDLIGASGGGIGGLTGGLLASRLTGTTASRGGRLGQRGLGFAESVGGAGLDLLGASGRSGFGSRAQQAGGRFGLGGAGGGRGVGVGLGQGGAAGGVQTITGGGGSQFEGDVRVTADPSINALIIYASPHDYETLKRVIELLDVRRRQVFVEAIILEVRVEKDRDLGIQLQGAVALGDAGVGFGRFQSPNALDVLANPALLSGIGGLVLAAASNQTIRLPDGSVVPAQAALLTAAQADTNVNVLSAPNILTTDNQEAEIVVGQNVPFIASRSTSEANLSNQFATVDRRDVGITLRITPQISEGGMVRLDIFEEVSDLIRQPIAGLDPNVVGPSTTIRSATTAVVVRDGQTVVIGGLISDDIENAINKVPFFGDIPFLGNFFKRTSSNRIKTNLLIFLTPHIIRGSREHRTLSIEQRDRTRAFMADENFPNRRRGVLEAPSWDPPLPEEKHEETETGETTEVQPSDRPSSSTGAPPVALPANRFVLLASIIERGDAPDNLASDSGLLAVEIPADSSLRTLFHAGGRYRYSSDRFEGLYQCLEAFPTAQEAFLIYPEGLPVDPAKGEFLHWRQLDDAQSANVSAWTALN